MDFNDKLHGLLTGAPTVQRSSKHFVLSLYETHYDFSIVLRDIYQVYIQAYLKVTRPIFIRPPTILNPPEGFLLLVDRPLYGLTDSSLHWFVTYSDHHKKQLSMIDSFHELCLLCIAGCLSKNIRFICGLRGITVVQN